MSDLVGNHIVGFPTRRLIPKALCPKAKVVRICERIFFFSLKSFKKDDASERSENVFLNHD